MVIISKAIIVSTLTGAVVATVPSSIICGDLCSKLWFFDITPTIGEKIMRATLICITKGTLYGAAVGYTVATITTLAIQFISRARPQIE